LRLVEPRRDIALPAAAARVLRSLP
jgi:hypothetical protein